MKATSWLDSRMDQPIGFELAPLGQFQRPNANPAVRSDGVRFRAVFRPLAARHDPPKNADGFATAADDLEQCAHTARMCCLGNTGWTARRVCAERLVQDRAGLCRKGCLDES